MASVKNLKIAFQKNSDSTVYATWSWTHKHTKEYSVEWEYTTGNGVWFLGSSSTETRKQSTYSFPNNAITVRIKVKPVSTTYKKKVKKKGKTTTVTTNYWTATKKTSGSFGVVKYKLPSQPSAPTVSLDGYKMTMKVEVSDENTDQMEFQIVQFNTSYTGNKTIDEWLKTHSDWVLDNVYKTLYVSKFLNICEVECTILKRSKYGVRCRGINSKGAKGDWSSWSSMVEAPPEQVTKLTCTANSTDSVKLTWDAVVNAKTYTVEYTSDSKYFDTTPDQVSSKDSIDGTYTFINGLDRSKRWYFRVKAVNESGVVSEKWSTIVSTVIGTKPNPPTTWSSALSVLTEEPVTLYWVHNTEDGSSQTYAEIEIQNGDDTKVITVRNNRSDEDKDKTSSYVLHTSYPEGATLKWRVRTKGVTDEYSDWSIQRTINVYDPPALNIMVMTPESENITAIQKLPFHIVCDNRSDGQVPIGYYITISPTISYETLSNTGEDKIVNAGEIIYSKYIDDLQDLDDPNTFVLSIGPEDISLENDITYKIVVNMTLDSGLHCEEEIEVPVSIEDTGVSLDAEISIDEDDMSAYITPYCLSASEEEAVEITQEEDGEEPEAPEQSNLESDVLLSVYRREFDSSFTLISENISNQLSKTVVDPHPSLDYARYRIVGKKATTGEVFFYDVPGIYIGATSIFIQWDEQWSDFNRNDPSSTDEPVTRGSMLELPYNVDIPESYDKDVELVEYIGRRSPVSYYGTQISESGSWATEIPKSDKDTIYALRRLAVYQGDVYVREPSGLGYWANVSVSFSQKHRDMTIPVTLNVTRVEGDGV